ncbi:MAG TPA: hypothetical protein VFV43_09080 [Limnobacter sp.]|nr:hypothetical protein [Limnobacter sp.]
MNLNAIQRAAAHHIKRGDNMVMDPAVVLGLSNAVQYALNVLNQIKQQAPDAATSALATEALTFMGDCDTM